MRGKSRASGLLARRDVEREAKRVFRLMLAKADCTLQWEPGLVGQPGDYLIQHQKNNAIVSAGNVASCYVEAFQSRGWLTGDRRKLVLGCAGEAWFRRQNAGEEAYRKQHQLRETATRLVNNVRRPVQVNAGESPLGWLHRRKDRAGNSLVSDAQFQAGERLRRDFTFAQMMPRVTSNWSGLATSRKQRRGGGNSAIEVRDNVLAAKKRVDEALQAVGPELSGVLIDVCCHLLGMEETERGQGWPQRSGKVVLLLALQGLARHYGLVGNDAGRAGNHTPISHWGAEGYRPTLDQRK